MLPLNFGGHPALHRYNALLDRKKRALHEPEYGSKLYEMRATRTKRFLSRRASSLGTRMMSWGQALTRFGETDRNFLLP